MLPQGKDNVERLVWGMQKGLDVRIRKTLTSIQRCGVCVEPASLGESLGILVCRDGGRSAKDGQLTILGFPQTSTITIHELPLG